ncbi:hypothetical protein TNCV_4338221 [Trichonephila clavipes]|uniref:Uncharacterized protein n=1 Tax=Trichonephila clavipes TaxID=2585209 RepID=A0A8X6SYT5_TRICX|nr:hypothetical protein TNCV_4338221 [Trichonephila clavipes]
MSEVDEVKTGKETSDSLISEENEERSEGTGNATFDPLLDLQCKFEEITLTLSGGKTTFSELIHQAENEMDERTHHDLGECSTHEQEKNRKSVSWDDDAVKISSTEDLDTLQDDSNPMDNMDSENNKETIPDSRSLIDVIIEMQGRENRNMEWFSKAERRMKEEIKKMNLWGELSYTDAEMAEEKDIKERKKKGVTELTEEWDTNKEAESGDVSKDDDTSVFYQNQGDDKNPETQQSAQLPKEREKNGGINQLSEEQLESEIDREVDRMNIILLNLKEDSHRQYYLKEFSQLAGSRSKLVGAQNKEPVPNLDSFSSDCKEMEEIYWEMMSQLTLKKISDYLHRLEEIKQRHNIVDLSDKTKPGKPSQKVSSKLMKIVEYLFSVKEMSGFGMTNSEVIVDLEQKRQQKRESTPFQVSEKEIHSNDEEMEKDLNEEIFLVLGPYNILEGDDVIDHVKNGIIIQLIDFGYDVYERIKDELSDILIKPIFLVYTNIRKNTLHIFPPEAKWYGKTSIIRIDKRETNRMEEFIYRNPKPISHLNVDVTKFLCKIKEENIFSRVMLRIAIDSLTEEILTRFLNRIYTEQTLLFKQKLALMFQNERAADWFGYSVKTLCTGESPYMYCRWAGFELLEQIINQRKTNKVSFCGLIPNQLPSLIHEIKSLDTYKLKNDFLTKHLRLKEKII